MRQNPATVQTLGSPSEPEPIPRMGDPCRHLVFLRQRIRGGSMTTFVGRSDEQNRFREVLREVSGRPDDGADEGYVVLVQGYGGMGKSTLLARLAAIADGKLPEPAVGRFAIFEVDWEDDRKLHGEDYIDFAGPPV